MGFIFKKFILIILLLIFNKILSTLRVITIDGLGLTKITDGTMEDVPYSAEVPISFTDNLNKNFAELFALYNNLVTIHNSIKKNINEATKKINETLTALKESGVINNV